PPPPPPRAGPPGGPPSAPFSSAAPAAERPGQAACRPGCWSRGAAAPASGGCGPWPMTMRAEEGERLHPGSRAEWRAWLAEHHDRSDEVWLVLWRQRSGRAGLTYEESVLEALCFGWIDGKSAGLDDQRQRLRSLPRKRG